MQASVYLRGGGVLVSVRSIYSSERIIVPNAESLKIIFVRVRMNVDIYICCLCIPSSSDKYVFQKLSVIFMYFIAIAQ